LGRRKEVKEDKNISKREVEKDKEKKAGWRDRKDV
jgi:hypothetical protein